MEWRVGTEEGTTRNTELLMSELESQTKHVVGFWQQADSMIRDMLMKDNSGIVMDDLGRECVLSGELVRN